MFDRQRLRDSIVTLLIIAFGLSLMGESLAAKITMGVVMLLFALYTSLRPSVMPNVVRDIFSNRFVLEDVDHWLKTEPGAAQAANFLYNLGSKDYMRFTRLMTEIRDQANQRAMKDVSDFFRKTPKE